MTNDRRLDDARRQLRRLEMLTDVVYGVALVVIVGWLPTPEEADGALWLLDVFRVRLDGVVGSLLGLLYVIVYWMRSNTLLSAVDRTSRGHASLSIASVFFLLFLLYVVRVNSQLAGASARASESFAVALVGIFAGLAWWRARREGLVRDEISDAERVDLQIEAFAEPLTALVTLPVAFVGAWWWNLSWLAYLPISRLLRRRGRRSVRSGD